MPARCVGARAAGPRLSAHLTAGGANPAPARCLPAPPRPAPRRGGGCEKPPPPPCRAPRRRARQWALASTRHPRAQRHA
eukprot:4270722-Pleurochrysis_carterae.AAC.1